MPRIKDPNSPRQKALLDYLLRFKADHDGLSPTMRQMAGVLNTSTSMVDFYLNRLEEQGKITRLGDAASRGIMIPGATWSPPGMPCKPPERSASDLEQMSHTK